MKHPSFREFTKIHGVWRRENEMLTQRNRRRRQLFKWSVIIVGVCAALLYLGVIAHVYEKSVSYTPGLLPVTVAENTVLHPAQSEDRIPGDVRFIRSNVLPPRSRFMGIPRVICDNTKSHRVWAECMGVGYRDTKVDRYLYKHRADD